MLLPPGSCPADPALPAGVVVRWDPASAARRRSEARERICVNGLWRFLPILESVPQARVSPPAPGDEWGYGKVPDSWRPKNALCRPMGLAAGVAGALESVFEAWYQRDITIPRDWGGRRVFLELDNPKVAAAVFIDGKRAGTVRWPGGRVDLTRHAQPGATHALALYVAVGRTGKDVQIDIGGGTTVRVSGQSRFRGLLGDLWLASEPSGARVADVFVKTSVRKSQLTVACELAGVDAACSYRLRARVTRGGQPVKSFETAPFAGAAQADIRGAWPDAALWDLDQPNLYELTVSLLDASGRLLDETTPLRFGFREFWIEGRDFYLNGKRIHFFVGKFEGPAWHTASSCHANAAEYFRRARFVGQNLMNGYTPSSHDTGAAGGSYFDDTLRAADELGMPITVALPTEATAIEGGRHAQPEARRPWEEQTRYFVRRYRHHPALLMWTASINRVGFWGDEYPLGLDGTYWAGRVMQNERLAARLPAVRWARGFLHTLDDTRPVYDHGGGADRDEMIAFNCYLNFTPIQERMEWIRHWAAHSRVPLYFTEYGLPYRGSWTDFREGPHLPRMPNSNVQLWLTEYGAIYNGPGAYALEPREVLAYDTLESLYTSGEDYHMWKTFKPGNWARNEAEWSNRNFFDIVAHFAVPIVRAYRTYGLSAVCLWEIHNEHWARPSHADYREPPKGKLRIDWQHAQQPGLSAVPVDWPPVREADLTPEGRLSRQVLAPVVAYIGGPPECFTAQDHVFAAGDAIGKQLIVVNDRRVPVDVTCTWEARLGEQVLGHGIETLTVPPGEAGRRPISLVAPAVRADQAGVIRFAWREAGAQGLAGEDVFAFTVLPPPAPPALPAKARVAVFDPAGHTARALRAEGVRFESVSAPTAPAGCRVFCVGREAIAPAGPGLDIEALTARGRTVVIFEQSETVLQKVWGFRTAHPGARRVYVRQADHPLCRGLHDELLRDWRGSATLEPPHNTYGPGYHGQRKENWCGFLNPRAERCGHSGTLATVLIEKPHRGDWSVPLDGEFDLQYTPLIEYLGPTGRVIFCQLDVSGRTQADPVAARVLRNLLVYAATAPEIELADACYVGEPALGALLGKLGLRGDGREIAIIGPGAEPDRAAAALAAARTVIGVGLDQAALKPYVPVALAGEPRGVLQTVFREPPSGVLAGLGNSEFHWRGRRPATVLTAVPAGWRLQADGLVAEGSADGKRYVLVQFNPELLDPSRPHHTYARPSYKRACTALSRILANAGVRLEAPLAQRLRAPLPPDADVANSRRWLDSYYADEPSKNDDPYRFRKW
ncbi:MAG: hypothetical protein JXR37_33770 [Kiritimatiellae bacterium]|nr:hypothetical protein [Kiritimatiellia bacterium]